YAGGGVATDNARGPEVDRLAVRVRPHLLRLDQPADDGDVAEQRHLAPALDVGPLGDPADDEGVAFLDEDQRVRAPLVDAGDEAAGARVDVRALRVVLDHDQQLDAVDVVRLEHDGRRHLAAGWRSLEVHRSAGGADRRARYHAP